jgi:hypothetical protein
MIFYRCRRPLISPELGEKQRVGWASAHQRQRRRRGPDLAPGTHLSQSGGLKPTLPKCLLCESRLLHAFVLLGSIVAGDDHRRNVRFSFSLARKRPSAPGQLPPFRMREFWHAKADFSSSERGLTVIPTGPEDDSSSRAVGIAHGAGGAAKRQKTDLYQRSLFMTVGISLKSNDC